MLSLTKKQKRLFLKWFFTFEAEANIKTKQITLIQANKDNINILNYLLLELGIIPNLSESIKFASNTSKKIKRKYYLISISNSIGIKEFIKEIGFEDKIKERRIISTFKNLKRVERGKKINLPINSSSLKEFMKPLMLNNQFYNHFYDIKRNKKISDYMLNKIINNYPKNHKNNKWYLYYKNILNSNVFFDEIKEIKEIPYDDYLIDLTVPKYHNFFAGYGGVLCHNTTLLERISGIWTDTHSEELKRGITIKLGYANASIYYCKKCNKYITKDKCECVHKQNLKE